MTDQQILEIALANGFKLKGQSDGTKELNPYVYDFARALLSTAQVEIGALNAEILQKSLDGWTEIQRLKAEVEQLRKDAERWNYSIKHGFPICFQVGWRAPLPNGNLTGGYPGFANANDAIDAAMQEMKPSREFESDIDGDEYK